MPCAPRRMALVMARFMARRNMMRFCSCWEIESAISCASTSGLRTSSILTCTGTPSIFCSSLLSASMSSPFLPMTTPGRALCTVMRAFFVGRSMMTFETAACASFFFRNSRTLRSSSSIPGKFLLFAYHFEAQLRFSARRNPIGLIFWPMLYFLPSPTVMKTLQVGFMIFAPRPLDCARKRRRNVPRSTQMCVIFSSSMSAPSLCSALAIADSSSLRRMTAPFFGLNCRMFSAWSTGLPRIWSATSRPFWAERRTPRSLAEVFMFPSLRFRPGCRGRCRGRGARGRRGRRRLAVSARSRGRGRGRRLRRARLGVALEDAGVGELAELVADHVLRHVHRHVLLAVVHGDREPDEIRQDRRAARPGLDRPLVVVLLRRLHFLDEVQVDERSLLD